ncbi:MAG: T9SS type A sorting domain-containing protein [Leadbetterella sp.]
MNKSAVKILFVLFFLVKLTVCTDLHAQNCSSNTINFKPSAVGGLVNLNQIPNFSLPFKIVFSGPTQYMSPQTLLNKGFTHIANPNSIAGYNKANRAYIMYNLGSANPAQPWSIERNPWGNSMSILERHWDGLIATYRQNTQNQPVDIFMVDIELQWKSDLQILELKNSRFTPTEIRSLSDAAFVEAYKRESQNLYSTCLSYIISRGGIDTRITSISSYSDAPILNTFINIQGKSWENWQKDPTSVNFLTYDFNRNTVGGSFYAQQSLLSPSAYFYYDYPHPFAGEYLSYMLFQIEANKAWSNKDQMVFLWQKYSANQDFSGRAIKPWMAESMAIFPFFAGAKGLWLWDDPSSVRPTDNLSNYEWFTFGLYRLSVFKDMFDGGTQVATVSARDYNENKQPVWRGIVKGNKILIAAHNPWADSENTEVNVNVSYSGWTQNIRLKGYETHLCQYDFVSSESLLKIFPNPNSDGSLKVNYSSKEDKNAVSIRIYDLIGKLFLHKGFSSSSQLNSAALDIKKLPKGKYLVVIEEDKQCTTANLIIP